MVASNWVLYNDDRIIREPFDPHKTEVTNYKVRARAPGTQAGLEELQAIRRGEGKQQQRWK